MSATAISAPRPAAQRRPDPVQERVLRVWHAVFGPDVEPHEDFFELGGTALDAVLTASRVSAEFYVDLPLTVVFQYPTVRELVAVLADRIGAAAHDSEFLPG